LGMSERADWISTPGIEHMAAARQLLEPALRKNHAQIAQSS
jgi:hypothetical protein